MSIAWQDKWKLQILLRSQCILETEVICKHGCCSSWPSINILFFSEGHSASPFEALYAAHSDQHHARPVTRVP